MGKSPGHQKWPEHRVREVHVDGRLRVEVDGEVVAMDRLERSATTTECPFKGTAHYFTLKVGDQRLEDSVWTYEDPFEEHRDLKDRVAFYDEKIPEMHIRAAS